MKPYYQDEWATIYHGDAREVLPVVAFDAVVTDPPYGLELGVLNNQRKIGGRGGRLGKQGYDSYPDTYEQFCSGIVPILRFAIEQAKRAVVFSGPHIHEQAKPDAIGGIYSPAATGRTAWGSKNFLPVLLYGKPHRAGRHRPTVLRDCSISEQVGHPCAKPIAWMRWAVELGSDASETILDPFMGSGTTLRAAKDLGRKSIGIDVSEAYCEIAAKRLAQGVLWEPK